jgi:hypothetical protein
MPRRDDDRPRRRHKASNTGLLVGLGVGGVVLLLVVVVVVILAVGRGAGPGDGARALGLPVKPDGRKVVGPFEEADDPTVVDRAWPKLVGTWREITTEPEPVVIEFLPDYRYRVTSMSAGQRDTETNPVVEIRDDAGTTNAKTRECYNLSYHERTRETVRTGNDIFNVYPDGTIEVGNRRYRRVR